MTIDHLALSLSVDSAPVLTQDGDTGQFVLQFDGEKGETIRIALTADSLQSLAQSCVRCLQGTAQTGAQNLSARQAMTDPETLRSAGQRLKGYDDRSLQTLLRETEWSTLLAFLWFLKDGDLLKRILANLSGRAALITMDELTEKWAGIDPDDPGRGGERQTGMDAVATVLATCQRLTACGELPELADLPGSQNGAAALTDEEKLALILGDGASTQQERQP
ncbi:MAG: hypothetical protein KAX55_13325 [Propionivibrio sp.]|nr:hypothetical protein [Propionivibrio sp.]